MKELAKDPEAVIASLAELVGIAQRMEIEAVERYRWLASEMSRRGEDDVAATFEALAEEEAHHIRAVEDWAAALPGVQEKALSEPPGWHLPAELGSSWEEAAESSLLTPFRALALAVDNEERAFAFYSFIAARAENPKVAQEAELLAGQELKHAALLRTWRRRAWHRQQKGQRGPRQRVESLPELEALIEAGERRFAETSEASGRRLHALEQLAEKLEEVLTAPADEAILERAQEALADVVARIARLRPHIGENA